MPLTGTMSIMGLYQWDNTIFDLMQLPEGLDKNALVNIIITRFANLEIMYPNPEVMKGLIGLWSLSSQYTWSKLYETLLMEYNPLDNYDRTETRTFNSQASGTSADSGTDTNTSTDSGSDTLAGTESGNTSNSTDESNTAQVAGFNSSANTFTDKEKHTIDNDSTGSYSKQNGATTTYGKRNVASVQYGHNNANTYNKNDSETIRARGNIGVTSSMQLIQAQRELVAFNIYDYIADDFKKRYCLMVY